jgi:hypothetical protein
MKKEIGPAIIAVAVVALVAVLGIYGYKVMTAEHAGEASPDAARKAMLQHMNEFKGGAQVNTGTKPTSTRPVAPGMPNRSAGTTN